MIDNFNFFIDDDYFYCFKSNDKFYLVAISDFYSDDILEITPAEYYSYYTEYVLGV